MRHCSATVLYRKQTNQILRIRVSEKANSNFAYDILNYELYDTKPYQYKHLNDMYKSVLQLMKNHNLVPYSYYQFGAYVYDITFIDVETLSFNRYGLIEEKGK